MNSTLSQHTASKLAFGAAGVLLCVMLAGLWQFGAAVGQWADMSLPQTWTDFRDGRTTAALEKQLDQKMPSRHALIASANSLRYLLLRGANEQVRIGRSDWLFLSEELQYDALAQTNMATRLKLLGQVSSVLKMKGIKLLLAVVPDKARIYERYLPAGNYPEYNAQRYQSALMGLHRHGVDAVDLLTPLLEAAKTQEVYYHSDTHWNQQGAKVASLALVDRIKELKISLGETQFTMTQAQLPSERAGDLLRLMGLEKVPNWLRPKPDSELVQTIAEISKAEQNSLFGDNATAIVLTGTSYSLRGNFHGYLQQAMSSKVLNTAKDGGGFLQAPGDYFKDEAFKTEPPQVIIWEVPERFLTLPLTQELTWFQTYQ
jgi:alginate O-acetyltransferase complex protein AlgJ